MYDMNDDIAQAYEDGYQEGFAKSRLVNFNSQEDFTDKINKLILRGKDQGFSVKGILDNWYTFDESTK